MGSAGKMNVFIWDMDETLILLKSLINGTYAEAFNGLKNVKNGREIGKIWEDQILQICDDYFFYEHVGSICRFTILFILLVADFIFGSFFFSFIFPQRTDCVKSFAFSNLFDNSDIKNLRRLRTSINHFWMLCVNTMMDKTSLITILTRMALGLYMMLSIKEN